MSFGKFITIIAVLYLIYYAINIVYDIYIKKESGNKAIGVNNIDVSDMIEEGFSPIEISAEETTFIDDKEDLDAVSSYEITQEFDVGGIDREEVDNVTIHGGYTINNLKDIYSGVAKGGKNPFLEITSKII